MRYSIGVVAALLALAVPASAVAGVQRGVVYGTGKTKTGSTKLLLDLYQPSGKSKAKRPLVVLIHGGGFTSGTRLQPEIVKIANGLVKRGDVVASIDYRVLKDDAVVSGRLAPLAAKTVDAPIFNAMLAATDDTLTAVDYLRTRAKALNVDMDRLALIGGSAGAITCDHVAYVLDDYGIKAPKIRFVGDLWGGIFLPPNADPSIPAKALENGEPPFLSVHGDQDTTVPVTLDDALTARAKSVGVKFEYYRVPGGTHGYGGTQFFTRKVKGGQTAFDRLLQLTQSYLKP